MLPSLPEKKFGLTANTFCAAEETLPSVVMRVSMPKVEAKSCVAYAMSRMSGSCCRVCMCVHVCINICAHMFKVNAIVMRCICDV